MLWTVKQAARELRLEPYQVYYRLTMGLVEAVKVGRVWRLDPKIVKAYGEQHLPRDGREPAGNFVYPGTSDAVRDGDFPAPYSKNLDGFGASPFGVWGALGTPNGGESARL
jgi:hypothetical protein